MQSLNQFEVRTNIEINPLYSYDNNILIILNKLFTLANPKLENYDMLYNEYYTTYLKENKNLILKVNKHLGLELSHFSPFTYIIYSHLLLTLHYLKKSDKITAMYEKFKYYEVLEILTNILNWFGNIFSNKLQIIYSSFNNTDSNEFHQDFKELLLKMEYTLCLLKSEIDVKKSYLFDINTDNSTAEIEILSKIKELPETILNLIDNINEDFYKTNFKGFNDIVSFINQSHANIIAEIFYKMLRNNNIYIENINKSKSIRNFLNLFGIDDLKAQKIIKAMSNLNEDSDIKQNLSVREFENFFAKNQIKLQVVIVKK